MQSNYLSKLLLVFIFFSFCGIVSAQFDNVLWNKQSADFFEECLVLGNGKMGTTVFGGVDSDKIYLNGITLWSREPVNANMNPEAYKNLPAVCEALKNENYKLAEELNKKNQGKNSEAYQPRGTMEINNHISGKVANYQSLINYRLQ
jgi:alpha-L-fucosidase 2